MSEFGTAQATKRLFDRRLMQIVFPPQTEQVARVLDRINQARAALTTAATASVSLRQLHGYQRQLTAANKPVEQTAGRSAASLACHPLDELNGAKPVPDPPRTR